MEYYFPKDIMEFENHFGIEIWEQMTKKYNQMISEEKREIFKLELTVKKKKEKYNKIEKIYLKMKHDEYDED